MMRLQNAVALGLALLMPACGGAAAPARAYESAAAYDSSYRTRGEGDSLASGSITNEAIGAETSSEQSLIVSGVSESDDGFFGGSGGEKSKAEPPPPPPPPPPSPADKRDRGPGKEAANIPPADPSQGANAGGKSTESSSAASLRAPMLIYTARINMAVFEVKSSLSEVESLARSLGGFLARRSDQSITIRVPAASFDDAIRRIEKLGDMLSRDVQAEDVTEEFHDTEIRLRNARAVRERLEQLLAKATKVEESIQIEKELERVSETIERLEGRLKFLRDRAAFSTITVIFQPKSAAELGKRPFNLPVPWLYQLGLGRLLSL